MEFNRSNHLVENETFERLVLLSRYLVQEDLWLDLYV